MAINGEILSNGENNGEIMKLAAEEMAGVNGGARRLAKISNICNMKYLKYGVGENGEENNESCRRSMRDIS
jgi:hypothetical protein